MTDYDRRLERLEAEMEPPALPLIIVTFSNSPLSEEEQIAVERRKRNWPDASSSWDLALVGRLAVQHSAKHAVVTLRPWNGRLQDPR